MPIDSRQRSSPQNLEINGEASVRRGTGSMFDGPADITDLVERSRDPGESGVGGSWAGGGAATLP